MGRRIVGSGFAWFAAMALFLGVSAIAQKSKELNITAKVPGDQRIEVVGFSGADLTFTSWDKPEVFVKVRVEFSSSDEDLEETYIRDVRLTESNTAERVVVEFDQPDHNTHWSFRDLLSFKFRSYTKRRVTGEVFVPKQNALYSDLRYGKIAIDRLEGKLDLDGQSNTVALKNCLNVRSVSNDYGNTTIEHSGGELRAENKSGKLTVTDFNGAVDVSANYSTVNLATIAKGATVTCQSGTVTVSDIGGDLSVKAPYSRVTIDRVHGMVKVENKSGSLSVETVDGIEIDAPYTSVEVSKVSGKASDAVRVKSQSSTITLRDVTGNLFLDSPYSTIRLRNIDGMVELQTTSGSVNADAVSGDWTSYTKYTTLDLQALRSKKVTIENQSGKVSVQLETPPDNLLINNSYADVSVEIPKGLSAKVRLKSDYGTIRSDLAVEVERMSSNSSAIAIGSVGSGGGTFRIETKSGNIGVTTRE